MKRSPSSWLERFPALGDISAAERDTIVAKSRTVEFSPGDRLYEAGARPGHYVLVLSGSVRVHQLTADGREIVFYRLTQGDTCVMTASALLRRMSYAAYAVAEGPVAVVLIATRDFDLLLGLSTRFRQFVFSEYASQFAKIVSLLNEFIEERIDARIAKALLRLGGGASTVTITHAALAAEIGTSREVVSRTLKKMQAGGLLHRERGALSVRDWPKLLRAAG